jgi:hypothetical protein
VLDRGGAAPASGSPAARECGHGGGPERRGSGREGQRAVGAASRGANGGGEELAWLGDGPQQELDASGQGRRQWLGLGGKHRCVPRPGAWLPF